VKVPTTRFGEVEVDDNDVFELASPIPGFPKTTNFFFIQKDNIKPFKWMQSVQEPELTFVVVEPYHFFHDYVPQISIYDANEIGASTVEEMTLLVIVVLPEDLTKMTANLRGPLILNRNTRQMKQVFIDSDKWGVRESIVEAIKRKEEAALEKNKQEQSKKSNNS